MRLEGRVCLVTGAATGMGRATAELFAREGAAVVVNYRASRDEAEDVVQTIAAAGGRAVTVQADVARKPDVRAMLDRVESEFGRLDYLVNNAGWSTRIPHHHLDLLTDEIWDHTLNTNLRGPFYCVRAARPMLAKQPGAAIVNVASVAGLSGFGSSMVYAASKAALIAMTKSLARALAPGIRVNAVAPGFVRTQFAGWPKETFDQAEKSTPLRRLPTVEDIAEAILFLAKAEAITGEILIVDGGSQTLAK